MCFNNDGKVSNYFAFSCLIIILDKFDGIVISAVVSVIRPFNAIVTNLLRCQCVSFTFVAYLLCVQLYDAGGCSVYFNW